MLDELAVEYEGKVTIGKMNVDENPNTPAAFGVRSIPYLVLMVNGEIADSITGAQPKAQFKALLDKHSANA
jgi:thioredoxin 1